MMKMDARSSFGKRCTGDCSRTACSKRNSISSRSDNRDAILDSRLLRASRRWGIERLLVGGLRDPAVRGVGSGMVAGMRAGSACEKRDAGPL